MKSYSTRQTMEPKDHEVKTENIKGITPIWDDEKLVGYTVQGEESHRFSELRQNPQRILFIDEDPVTTISTLYTPIQHPKLFKEFEETVLRRFPDATVKYYEGGTEHQVIAVYTLDKAKIPWDTDKVPGEYEYSIMATNSLDTTLGIHLIGAWETKDGTVLVVEEGVRRTYHHARSGGDVDKIVDQVVGQFNRMVDNHEMPLVDWEKLRDTELTKGIIINTLNYLWMTKTEIAKLVDEYGYHFEMDAGKFIDFEKKKSRKRVPRTVWDWMMILASLANDAKTAYRQFEIQKKVPTAIRRAVNRM